MVFGFRAAGSRPLCSRSLCAACVSIGRSDLGTQPRACVVCGDRCTAGSDTRSPRTQSGPNGRPGRAQFTRCAAKSEHGSRRRSLKRHHVSSKIALWHNPECDDETSQDSDDDDDTSNDLNSNNDETDVPITFWLQDRVCYLIAWKLNPRLSGPKLPLHPFRRYNASVVSPCLALLARTDLAAAQHACFARNRVRRLGGLFTAEVVGLSELKCRLTLGVLALQP